MKFFLGSFLFAVFASSLVEGQTYRVVLYDNPPLVSASETGSPQGIFVDFLNSLELGQSGLKIEYVSAPFREGIAMLERGEVDIMPAVAMTYDRQEKLLFNKVEVVRNRAVIYRHRGVALSDIEDISGKRVALVAKDVHAEAFKQFCEIYGLFPTPVSVPGYVEAVEAVQNGDADIAVLNEIFASRMGRNRDLVSTTISFSPVSLRFAFRPDIDPAVVTMIDQRVEQQLDDSASPLSRSLSRYLSPYDKIIIPNWVWVGVGVIVLIVVVVIQFNRTLRNTVAKRTEELRIERDRAAAADRTKSHFLANVSHEIRTPLNGILGFSQLLEMQTNLTGEEKDWVSAIMESSHRLENVLGAILDYSSMVSDEFGSRIEPVDLAILLEESIDGIRAESPADSSRLEVRMQDISNHIYQTDPKAWYLITRNLVSNAFRFSGDGPVQLVVCEKESDGRFEVELFVEDTGPGIPEHLQEKLLLPFEQADMSPSRKVDGLGLGLSLVFSVVNQCGGKLVMKNLNPGFRISVRMPLVRITENIPKGD